MARRTYARIDSGVVAELMRTEADVTTLFHPELTWVEITGRDDVDERWTYDGSNFQAPVHATGARIANLAELELQVRALAARLAALSASH